jgi:hypothetical protein
MQQVYILSVIQKVLWLRYMGKSVNLERILEELEDKPVKISQIG